MSPFRFPRLEIAALVLLGAFILVGAPAVSFHPDETSWLYQSRDLEQLAADPAALAWRAEEPPSAPMTYRLLNAPLAKYVLGLARLAAGYPESAVRSDWDWTRSWDENLRASAVPPARLLSAGRVASAFLLLPALVAIYCAGRALGGRTSGLAAALLLATNALILLHARRSMSEGALVLGVSLALLGLLYADRHPWLAGVAAGLALAAKTSAGVWIPLGWMGAGWTSDPNAKRPWHLAARIAAYTASAGLTIVLLYPVLWAEPLGAVRAMLRARQELVAAQVATFQQSMPWAVLDSPQERIVSALAQLFIAPPQFAEAANYAAETAEEERAYRAAPGTNLLRGFLGGGAMLVASIFGVFIGIRVEGRMGASSRRSVALALLATTVQALALLAFVPLSFQRYVLPLVPLACLWAGRGVAGLIAAVNQSRRT